MEGVSLDSLALISSSPALDLWTSSEAKAAAPPYARAMHHSARMIWGCVALVALAIVLGAAGVKAAYLGLLALPCVLMMGAMVWMMVRGMHRGSHGGESK